VSKRHNTSRRRTYGRRLHEVHERHERRPERDRSELDLAASHDESEMDPIAFLDSRAARARYGYAD
jgi:hypothetical protein